MRKDPYRLGTLWGMGLAITLAMPAAAQVKIAYIDPLSGGAASAGINAQKHITYMIDRDQRRRRPQRREARGHLVRQQGRSRRNR